MSAFFSRRRQIGVVQGATFYRHPKPKDGKCPRCRTPMNGVWLSEQNYEELLKRLETRNG